ncbi:DUF5052 family protein [Abyssicoccus albus]|uniref:Uncharacterized protein DUF5052 n=1 Tax=Abyssicoccus albus TaxID=1817405 RepID=A0A1Q1FZW1_9BACL|nr:DUF5052 family protein [Abyssicoccus albus]AQL55636.1 hypothetical protein BVH56_01055 [Abyssicoccus albus]RPF56511.1 uncharacterized protein DUF5052 [Abyssicoccus albus]
MKKFKYFLVISTTAMLLSGCAALDDWGKDFESNTSGLERTVTIYSEDGEVIKQYKGKNVRTKNSSETGNQVILNIDGKRIQIINANVVIEEKGVEDVEVSK